VVKNICSIYTFFIYFTKTNNYKLHSSINIIIIIIIFLLKVDETQLKISVQFEGTISFNKREKVYVN